MKRTAMIVTLLATAALVASAQARATKQTAGAVAAAKKGDDSPTIVSPYTSGIHIPEWFRTHNISEVKEEALKSRQIVSPYTQNIRIPDWFGNYHIKYVR